MTWHTWHVSRGAGAGFFPIREVATRCSVLFTPSGRTSKLLFGTVVRALISLKTSDALSTCPELIACRFCTRVDFPQILFPGWGWSAGVRSSSTRSKTAIESSPSLSQLITGARGRGRAPGWEIYSDCSSGACGAPRSLSQFGVISTKIEIS